MTKGWRRDRRGAGALTRAFARQWRVGGPIHTDLEFQCIAVPMRDGARLRADVLRPRAEPDRLRPVVVIRTPYGRRLLGSGLTARLLAGKGAVVVVVSCRGTFDSDGEFEPFVHEAQDGQDTLAWVRQQQWGHGRRLVTWGASYEGNAQWATAAGGPESPDGLVIQLGSSSMRDSFVYRHGALAVADVLAWLRIVRAQGSILAMASDVAATRRELRAAARLPLASLDERAGYGTVPWFRRWVSAGPDDPFWAPLEYRSAAAVQQRAARWHLTAGWHDIYVRETLADYAALVEVGAAVRLVIGPWKHMDSGYVREVFSEALHVVHGSSDQADGVRVWTSGDEAGWLELPVWPPSTRDRTWYLDTSRLLAESAAGTTTTEVTGGALPSPSLGGIRAFTPRDPVQDNSEREAREDVKHFTSVPLAAPLRLMGSPRVHLDVEASSPGHIDIHVRLCEVDRRGVSRNVVDGFRRLVLKRGGTQVQLDLDPTAHTLAAGSSVRLQVANGAFPTWGPNPGSDGLGADVLGSWSIRHGSVAPSWLVLPTGTARAAG